MYVEFEVDNRDEFLENLRWGKTSENLKAFLFSKEETHEGNFRIILTPTNGKGIRVVVEKQTGENLLGEPIYKLWDDVSNFERLKAYNWLVKALFQMLAEQRKSLVGVPDGNKTGL